MSNDIIYQKCTTEYNTPYHSEEAVSSLVTLEEANEDDLVDIDDQYFHSQRDICHR